MSFIKSLLKGDEQLNKETEQMEENIDTETPKEEVVENVIEEEAEEVVAEETPVEEAPAEEADKSFTDSQVKSIVKEAITEALDKIEAKRGLVEKDVDTFKDAIKNAEVGELAIASGFFTSKI